VADHSYRPFSDLVASRRLKAEIGQFQNWRAICSPGRFEGFAKIIYKNLIS
jgi:hypothetical protein